MILELDCGNSYIKWRILNPVGHIVLLSGWANSATDLIGSSAALSNYDIQACRLVSVRSDSETAGLVDAISSFFAVPVLVAKVSRSLAGVANGYSEYAKLGRDRWLALVGGFSIARRSCLVLDLGTAVTADFVSAKGQHLGGFICPGLPLMTQYLKNHTSKIRYDREAALSVFEGMGVGTSTAEAVERGCLWMLRGFALEQERLAVEHFGSDFQIFLTGGDAGLIAAALPNAQILPDLVFVGLALACPIS